MVCLLLRGENSVSCFILLSCLFFQFCLFLSECLNLGTDQSFLNVVVDGNFVEQVDGFTYLGSFQSSDGYCRMDIKRRIALASSVVSSLDNIWRNQHLSLPLKTCIYQHSPSRSYCTQQKLLDHFSYGHENSGSIPLHFRCQCKML